MKDVIELISKELDNIIEGKRASEFMLMSICLGEKRKPIQLINSLRFVNLKGTAFGIVLNYCADHRSIYDRDVLTLINVSKVFEEFSSENYGYEGLCYYKNFEIDKEAILNKLSDVFKVLDGVVRSSEVEVNYIKDALKL